MEEEVDVEEGSLAQGFRRKKKKAEEEEDGNFRSRPLPTLPRPVQTFLHASKLLKIVKPPDSAKRSSEHKDLPGLNIYNLLGLEKFQRCSLFHEKRDFMGIF